MPLLAGFHEQKNDSSCVEYNTNFTTELYDMHVWIQSTIIYTERLQVLQNSNAVNESIHSVGQCLSLGHKAEDII